MPDFLDDSKLMLIEGQASCPNDLKKKLPGYIAYALLVFKVPWKKVAPIRMMSELRCPVFVAPSVHLLKVAHETIAKFIPPDDYECFEAAEFAKKYCIRWKSKKCVGILLCESHAHTFRDLVVDKP